MLGQNSNSSGVSVGGSDNSSSGVVTDNSSVNQSHLKQYTDIFNKNQQNNQHSTDNRNNNNSTTEIDLFAENQEKHNNLGHLNWYYSPVRVCEHCYLVYRELDRKRALRHKNMKKAQRVEVEQNEVEKGREIEKKIFAQRQFVSRMAASQKDINANANKAVDSNNSQFNNSSGGNNSYKQSLRSGNNNNISSTDLLYGGDSLAFESVAGGDSYYDGVAANYHKAQQLQLKSKCFVVCCVFVLCLCMVCSV